MHQTAVNSVIEAEQVLIARVLVDPTELPVLKLEPEDFGDPEYGKAWGVMRRLAGENRRIDLVTLKHEGVDIGDPTVILSSLTRAPLDEYTTIIRREAYRRRVLGELDRTELLVREARDEAEIMDSVSSALAPIVNLDTGDGLISWTAAWLEYRPPDNTGLTWGFRDLDAAIQPAAPGHMIVVGARPSVGKTTLAEHIALHWATRSDLPVMFVSAEMTVNQLMHRQALRSPVAPEGVSKTVTDAPSVNMYYLDDPRASTSVIRRHAARLRMQSGGIGAFVVDYLQLLADQGDPEYIRVTRISNELKRIAREFDCPLLALAQLSRASEQRDDKRPRLADLRDSGAIEQDADLVFGLWRDNNADPYLSLAVLKNRHGPMGMTIELNFDLAHVAVRDS